MRVYTNKGLKEYSLCVTDKCAFMNKVVQSSYQMAECSISVDEVKSSERGKHFINDVGPTFVDRLLLYQFMYILF